MLFDFYTFLISLADGLPPSGPLREAMQACAALGFLTGFSGAKAEASEANAGAKGIQGHPRKTRDHPEVFVCQDSHSVTYWFGGGARVLFPDL